jgi:thiamine biosynthesis lipoprotein
MGTNVEIYLYARDGDRAAALVEAAFQEIERVEAALSMYRPTSEVSRINADAATRAVTTDPEVFDLLQRAFDYSQRTGGAFDITVGSLVKAWGFFRNAGRYPSAEELSQAQATSGWRHVELEKATRSVRFLVEGLELDFGGIGKGFALDCAARTLRSHGVEAALLGAGQSSYYAIGTPPGSDGWAVTVPSPHRSALPLSKVLLRDRSLSTSGNDKQYFELDGHRYSHIINPLTGRPATGMLQVTVAARTATDSDALSTALFVVGPERAVDLVSEIRGATALLVTERDGEDRVVAIEWQGTFISAGR